ncbi:C40 family peptidase [Bacillus shivajii]|uniref:C40 family peptidase n=1 Tax=Bacillus shivajii TaxID=1983719 RepID=UPI001CFA9108|nr:NlpC/P60 family protein [Bacillus shivajii]UCZ52522.1 C40 family peptidase [Bacillus shivajii]
MRTIIAVFALFLLFMPAYEAINIVYDETNDAFLSIEDHSYHHHAQKVLDSPFKLNGTTPKEGFSSGTLVQYLFREVEGVLLSRRVELQRELGEHVSTQELQEGDLLFFKGEKGLFSAVYLNNDEFIVATRHGVELRSLTRNNSYKKRFLEARRLSEEEKKRLSPSTYKNHDHPAIREALRMLHRPYLLTGDTLAAFDCSFLVQHAFEELNVHLPRITYQQWKVGKEIPLDDAKPGDVLYFSGTWQEGISHTGIYLGDNYFIHASAEEGETTISYLGDAWMKHFTGVKRFDHIQLNVNDPIIGTASTLLNLPYTKNGEKPDQGFNYSGLTYYIMKQHDRNFPRTAKKQWKYGAPVKLGEEQTGDIFFFESDKGYILPALHLGDGQLLVVRKDEGVSIVDPRFSYYWSYERLKGIRTYERD